MILRKNIVMMAIVFYNFTFSMDDLSKSHQFARECVDCLSKKISGELRKTSYNNIVYADKHEACSLLTKIEPLISSAEKECNFPWRRDLIMSKLIVKQFLVYGLVENLVNRLLKSSSRYEFYLDGYNREYFHLPIPLSLQSFIYKRAIHKYISKDMSFYEILPDYVTINFNNTQSFVWGDFLRPLPGKRIEICRSMNEAELIAIESSIAKEQDCDSRYYNSRTRDGGYRLPIFIAFKNLTAELYWCMIALFNSMGNGKRLNGLSKTKLIKEIPVVDALHLKELINREIAIIQQAKL
jgi:hypothetical protein